MISTVKNKKPLVLCLTNDVTKNFCANVLLALGASPIMSHDRQEIEELVNVCSSLYINIGTLTKNFIKLCLCAISCANHKKIPIVLDPVGVSASDFRKEAALTIIETAKNLTIKGNASEILALADHKSTAHGVDSLDSTESALSCAKTLISQSKISHVVITGEHDYILSTATMSKNPHGTPLMKVVTGMGCALGGALSAALGSDKDEHTMLHEMVTHYTLSGEQAFLKAKGPGSFSVYFLDCVAL